MQIGTSRFGDVEIGVDDIILFPSGLVGYEDLRHWVLLGDVENEAIGWLQCVAGPDVSMCVVSPRRFVPEYQVRVGRGELDSLELAAADHAYVLTIIGKADGALTLNLKAPIIVNLDRRLGRQVITMDEQPLQLHLASLSAPLRKSA